MGSFVEDQEVALFENFGKVITSPYIGALLPFLLTFLFYGLRNTDEEAHVNTRPEDEEEMADWESGPARILAALISFVFSGLGVVLLIEAGRTGEPNQYLCNKTNSSNYSIDIYACQSQKELIHGTWGRFTVFLSPIALSLTAMSSLVLPKCGSLLKINMAKVLYYMCAVFYVVHVSHFQYNFDSLSNILIYIKSFAMIFILFTILLLVSVNTENDRELNTKIESVFAVFGVIISLHVGYSGYRLLHGKGNTVVTACHILYFSLSFAFTMFHFELLPHVLLGMCLFAIPPVCPFVVSLAAWCFDSVWSDLDRVSLELIQNFAETSIPRIHRERLYYERPGRYRNPNGFANTRSKHSVIRGLD